MKIDVFGKIYIALMSVYFVVSGFNVLWDIDAKLARIGLSAINSDGKIAFILIYCSLMIGIGISIALLYYYSKAWQYSTLLASTIIAAFISFRLLGAYMLAELSNTQGAFIAVELLEVTIGIFLLCKSGKPNQKIT